MFGIDEKALTKLSTLNVTIALIVSMIGQVACLIGMWAVLQAFTNGVIPWNTVIMTAIFVALCFGWLVFVIRKSVGQSKVPNSDH